MGTDLRNWRNNKTSTDWQCTTRNKTVTCPAVVKQIGDSFTLRKNHTHTAVPGTLQAVMVKKQVREQAKENVYRQASAIVETALLNHADPDLPEGSRPKQTNLLRTVTRVREGLRPTEPKDLNFELAENFIPEDFNVKDVHVDDYRHLVFYTSDQMKVLSSCTTWYLDGTFKVVRSPFVQMFSIHAFLHSDGNIKQVPLAFCLMSRRLTIDYKAVLNALTVSMPRRPAVQVAVCDFERGMWKALRKVFDGIVVRGCNFHFTQAVWRRIQRYGLAIGFFLLGSINNLPYVIVTSAASTIADSFDQRNNVGVVFFANVALSVIVKSINGFLLLKVPYGLRIFINALIMLIGLFGVAFAFDFWFAIVCIVFVGASAAFGENVALGYLRLFPSKFVNAWSSGTGMAGVLGSTIYIIFGCAVGAGGDNTEKLKNLTKYAFLLTSPVVLVYLLAYFWIIKRSDEEELVDVVDTDVQGEKEPLLYGSSDGELDEVSESAGESKETALARIWRCFKLILWVSVNLCLVYMFEYVAQGSAAKVRPKSEYNKGCPELYAALSLCYQAGVFVSRSSVQLFTIKRIEILSILQLINMILWLVDVHAKFIPVYLLPPLMIYVGLLGGASYVNIFYILLNDKKYPEEDRELCINIAALFITVGIISGTGLETLLFNTALKKD